MQHVSKLKIEILYEFDDDNERSLVTRFDVPGGWIYRSFHFLKKPEEISNSLCFVPFPPKSNSKLTSTDSQDESPGRLVGGLSKAPKKAPSMGEGAES